MGHIAFRVKCLPDLTNGFLGVGAAVCTFDGPLDDLKEIRPLAISTTVRRDLLERSLSQLGFVVDHAKDTVTHVVGNPRWINAFLFAI